MAPAPPATWHSRDRRVVLGGLLLISLLAWLDLCRRSAQMSVSMAMSGMPEMPDMVMPVATATPAELLTLLLMWAVMMVAMMTPTIAPIVLLYAKFARTSAAQRAPLAPVGWFICGYLAVWTLFSAVATAAQWALGSLALLNADMALASGHLAGVLLLLAGIYQWLPWKAACLKHCRTPLQFIQHHGGFRAEIAGTIGIGFQHGAYCLGCCWALMLLLFVGGVMNLLWIAGLMFYVLLEKLLPDARLLSQLVGIGAATAGLILLVR